MAVARVQSVTAGFSQTTAQTANFSTSPVAGNLLILTVVAANSGSITNSMTTPTGWTAGPTKSGSAGADRGIASLFWKIAAGADANPTVTITGANASAMLLEEWSGLAAATPVDITFTGAAINDVSGSVSVSAGTTTNANDWIYSALGGRAGSALTTTWSGGQSSDVNYTSSANATCKMAASAQSVSATGSYTPAASLSSTVCGGIIAIAFKQGVTTVSGTAAADLGGLTASAAGVRTVSGTASAAVGAVAASATGVRTTRGTALATLGVVAAAASGVRTDIGAASAPLGGLTASAVSAHVVNGTASAALGGLTATALGVRTVPGTASAPLGGLTATAAGVRTVPAIASAALGSLLASATGTRTDVAAASAALGVLTAAATGAAGGSGVALADLGALIAAAVGTVTGVIVAPVAGPFRWGFTMLAPGSALIPVEAGLDFIEWGFVMLQPGDALIGDPA